MKNKQKSMMTMVLLAGVLITILVYMYVYSEFNKKTENLKNTNATLQTRVDELKEYYDAMEEHQEDIKKMTAEIEKKLGVFPAYVREEDAVALALQPLKKQILIDFTSIAMGNNEVIGTIDAEVVQAAKLEKYQDKIEIYEKLVTYSSVTTYSDIKDVIKIYNAYGDGMNIDTISFFKVADTNVLEGTIDCKFYFATGTGASYKAPTFSTYPVGSTDLFKVVGSEEEIDYSVFGLGEDEIPVVE